MLPHNSVYVRLGKSPVHGVGVVAIRTIPKGMPIYRVPPKLRRDMSWVHRSQIENIDKVHMSFYKDFAIEIGDWLGCPKSFDELDVSWYQNHSDTPNVVVADEAFAARRTIRPGEELLIDYDSCFEDADEIGPPTFGALPHEDVRARLRVTRRGAVGVVAILPIQKGASVFGLFWLQGSIVVPEAKIQRVEATSRRLYEEFTTLRSDGSRRCPASFNLINAPWYVRRCSGPLEFAVTRNAYPNVDANMTALRDIAVGEELLQP